MLASCARKPTYPRRLGRRGSSARMISLICHIDIQTVVLLQFAVFQLINFTFFFFLPQMDKLFPLHTITLTNKIDTEQTELLNILLPIYTNISKFQGTQAVSKLCEKADLIIQLNQQKVFLDDCNGEDDLEQVLLPQGLCDTHLFQSSHEVQSLQEVHLSI